MKIIIRFFSFLFCMQSFSQANSNQDKINQYLTDYFSQDREIIHVQFNKILYTNNEDIAFKGYILSKNKNLPNTNTTNVQLVVYNDEEQIVQKQLLFAQNGIFSGGIHLNKKFKVGKYHFHFYTNWMNNFKEDDSFNQTIEIIDKSTPYAFETNEPNWETAEVSLFPEGGIIINDIVNTIGVKITDCNKKGIEIAEGLILDSKSKEITTFYTNKMGNGVFYLRPDLNEQYTLKINSDKLKITQPLGKIAETGITLSAPNNPAKNNLLVILKTNEKGLRTYKNKKFTVLVQQNGNSMLQEVTFNNNKTEQPYYFNKVYLSNGVNTIRVLDEDLNEITERLTFIEEDANSSATVDAEITANDSIVLSGTADVDKAHLSISILPEKSVCFNQKKSILGTFYLNAYLEKPISDTYFYFNLDNETRRRDIEILLLNQSKNKYLWENIKAGPPKISYEFEKGITISGKVEKEIKPNSKNKILLIALKKKLFEQTSIDQNNDFKFEHFFVQDSTFLSLQMTNEKNTTLTTKIEARIARNEPRFVLGPSFEKTFCSAIKTHENVFNFLPPKTKASELREVTLKNTFKKDVFTHRAEADMSPMSKSFKFDDKDHRTLLNFLSANGYNTGISPTDGNVYIRDNRSSFMGQSAGSPNIYLDNFLLFDFSEISNLTLDQIDEIYIDKTGSSDTSINGQGTIKIFLKIGQKNNHFKIKFTKLIVTKGFAQDFVYKTAPIENQDEFNYFGTLNWSPNIELNEDFEIKIPKNQQKEIEVIIEGFTDEGHLISEVKKVRLQGND